MIQLIDDTQTELLAKMDTFIQANPKGHFLQSPQWRCVKAGWKWRGVLVWEEDRLVGTLSLLIRSLPGGITLLYAPRGPVCDLIDRSVLEQLFQGAKQIADTCHGCALILDPDVKEDDSAFQTILSDLGFSGQQSLGFEGIQPRFVFRLPLDGRDEDAVFAGFSSKTRYQVRLARRHRVEISFWQGDQFIPDHSLAAFSQLMEETGKRDDFLVRDYAYFARLLNALGAHARLYLATLEGTAIAGTIAVQYGDKTWYLYGASSNQHREAMPNYLLQWEMIRWAISSGCRIYDFRGVSGDVTPDSPLYGLYRFKKGFGGDFTAFCGEYTKVYRPCSYRLFQLEKKGNQVLRKLLRKVRERS